MNPISYTQRPADCQPIIDFRAECNTPTATAAPPAGPATPTPTGDLFSQIKPEMPPIDGKPHTDAGFLHFWSLPDWSGETLRHGLTVAGAAAALVLLLAVVIGAGAWLVAWQPARLRNFSFGSLAVMPGRAALMSWDWHAPVTQFQSGATEMLAGRPIHGLAVMAILLIPLAWMSATLGYTSRLIRLYTHGFSSPALTERAVWYRDQRQLRNATRLARYRLPWATGGINPHPVIGRLALEETAAPPTSMLRALFARTETRLIVPWIKTREHMVTVAGSGKGKTTLMFRVLMAWYVAAWLRHRQWWRLFTRPGRPMAFVIDCNGGPESVKAANKLARWFRAFGMPAPRIGIISHRPEHVKLHMWDESVDDLVAILCSMISGGATPTTATEKYFHEIREGLINLIMRVPERVEVVNGVPTAIGENPPRSWDEFLSLFDVKKLARRYGGVFDPDKPWAGVPGIDAEIAATVAGQQPVMYSARMEFGNLRRALGDMFDGTASLLDFDLVYIILEGTTMPDRARSQFGALGCMLEQLADKEHGREAFAAIDEFSAVSDGRTRADKWVMRLRKARIGTWWFAQDWNGLGFDDEQRESLVSSGSGGGIHGGQEGPNVDKLAKSYGTKRRFDLSRKLINGAAAGDEGNVQAQDAWLIDPNKLRRLDKGDVVHVSQGRARWGHVAPLPDEPPANLRVLPGLDRFEAKPPLAEVIDLDKHRKAS